MVTTCLQVVQDSVLRLQVEAKVSLIKEVLLLEGGNVGEVMVVDGHGAKVHTRAVWDDGAFVYPPNTR